MKKSFKAALSLMLCAVMIGSFAVIGFAGTDRITTCDENCEFYPTIIVPGNAQSSVCVTDDDGNFIHDKNGNQIAAFPAYFPMKQVIARTALPVLASLATQRDAGISDAFADVIDLSFGINACDLDGKVVTNVVTEKFFYPYSECSDYEKSLINMHIPLEKYPTALPKDHLYYFAYNSMGNHMDIAYELYDYIQMVRAQTGHDKVNLVPMSQGATITSAMLDYKPEVMDQLHKVLFVVPAISGTVLFGDVMTGRLNFLNKDYLYNGFFEDMRLLDEHTARLIEVALRVLPDEVLMATLNKGVEHLMENTISRSTSMWALVPPEDYPAAAERYLSSPEMASIKAQTDRYYQAQLNAYNNIQKLVEKGVQVFDIAEYDYPIISVGERWNTLNGDFMLHLRGTSLGAYSANCGEMLPDGYAQKNTHCTDPSHNHISPDRVVDASAGLLPDTTFYFDVQRHDLTQHNDVILKLAMRMIADDEITDVYSSPEFPQFLSGRNVQNLLELMNTAKALKADGKSNADIDAAAANAQAALDNNLATGEDILECEQALRECLVNAGAVKPEKAAKDPSFLRRVSLWLYENYGTNGFSEIPALAFKKLFAGVKGIFAK